MGAQSLINRAREYWRAPDEFRLRHPGHPWFVWTLGRPTDDPIVAPTLTLGGPKSSPNLGDPLAIPVQKGKASVFAMGVTIGRTENNDVVLRHEQVSRFHAYVTQTPKGFALVDAESKNGTFVAEERLAPKKPKLLPPQCAVRFGALEVHYYSSDALLDYFATR